MKLFVDMDGTLAEFKYVALEELFRENYFLELQPNWNVLNGVKKFLNSDVEVFVLSSILPESKFALTEKNMWLDKYLPEIPKENRIFPPCGTSKADAISCLGKDCFLLDDYTLNLKEWENAGGTAIKLLNGINGNNGTWRDKKITYLLPPTHFAKELKILLEVR